MKKLIHEDGTILFTSITEHPPDKKKIQRIIKEYKNKSSKSELVSVRIPDFLNRMLKVTAERKGISYSDYVRNLLSWPFLVTVLEDAIKEGVFSTKDEAEATLNEEVQRIDLFLKEIERIHTAEKFIRGMKDHYKHLIIELNEVVFNVILNKENE